MIRQSPQSWTPFPQLQTPRLILRQVHSSDSLALFKMLSDEETMRYWNSPPFQQESQATNFILEMQTALATGLGIRWGIALQDSSDQLIGLGGYYAWNQQHCRAEMHYILNRQFWGQGFASEALKAFINFGFERMELHSLEAQVTYGNSDSERLLSRLGFALEGHLRENYRVGDTFVDSLVYSMLRKNWTRFES